MTQYTFAGIDLPNIYGVSAPVPARIGSGVPIARHGAVFGKRFLDARNISLQGVWLPTTGQSFMDMELAYSNFISSLFIAGESRLTLRKNWFYNAILKDMNEGKREIGSIEFDMSFYLADPRQYKLGTSSDGTNDTESSIALTWDAAFNTSPGVWTPNRLSIVAGAGYPASIQIIPKYGTSYVASESLIWKPASTGTTVIYLEKQRAIRNNIDVTSEFDGNFFDINPSSTMKINAIPSTNLSATLIYREATL